MRPPGRLLTFSTVIFLLDSFLLSASGLAQIPGSTSKSMSTGAASPGTPVPPPDSEELLQKASRIISFSNGHLGDAGGAFLLSETSRAQFVLIGESHYDHDTPLFADALYRDLHDKYGFHHLVVEQDAVGIEDALKPGVRGDVKALAKIAQRDPYLIGFASDQDLQFLADVARLETNPDPIWGLEQTQGTTRYLQELAGLAPSADVRAECATLLAAARKIEGTRGSHGNYLSDERDALTRMTSLRDQFQATAGSRAKILLDALVKSAEIYSYYRRAENGEFVGLYNNTVRETWFKQGFIADYHRSVTLGDPMPKALLKFGQEHMYHGLNPLPAFPIGNFAHEFAIAHGMEAYGIAVVPLGTYSSWSDLPAWLLPLLPPAPPAHPVLIDLKSLRPYQRLFRVKVAEKDQWQLRVFINGYDAIILLPESRKADMSLTGFPNPF
jgi:hypothetical protein